MPEQLLTAESAPSSLTTTLAEPFAWPARRPLLIAEWRHLAMLNYEVDPQILAPLVPAGTELDLWQDRAFVSIVGFLFRRTRLFGVRIPGHANFEEVNLRFYVRREVAGECRRGVAFIRELVPRRAVTFVANTLYGERYLTVPMSHALLDPAVAAEGPPRELRYGWRFAGGEGRIVMQPVGEPAPLAPGSHEEFIAEHYWGYTAHPRGRASEYLVAHPPWRVCSAARGEFAGDIATLYGEQFVPYLAAEPTSAFWAEGSAVRVFKGCRL
jgi:uncharacterized protein YqjF (DUF2071 family)